ncbi:XRE family transcriptional regulator [Mesorhizobium sp. DCY119]|nr:XRE family transcriptional regulator [Mesorhizobium sp. DCY119]
MNMSDEEDSRLLLVRERLRATMEGNGGQKAVSKLTGIPVNTLGNYVRGIVAEPPASNLVKIAKACGVSASWLMGLEKSGSSPIGISAGDVEAYEGQPIVFGSKAAKSHCRWRVASRALELAGYLPGDLLEFDLGGRPSRGEPVVAEVRNETGEVSSVLRLFQPPVLTAHTADPTIDARPIQLDPAEARVKVLGAFIRMVRERST